jgi:CTP synthase (UTP-ammonia lyase)
MKVSIAIIGEFDESLQSHRATRRALKHAADFIGARVESAWFSSWDIDARLFEEFDGIFLAPGQRYADFDKSLGAVRYARENSFPCLGTCRGFQHMVLEFARNVLGDRDAYHEEYNADAKNLFLTKLPAASVRRRRPIDVDRNSPLASIYRRNTVLERFYGSFGVNPKVERRLEKAGLVSMASDSFGNYKVGGIIDHPFFYGTLFIPQMRSTKMTPHPLVTTFLKAAIVMQTFRRNNR